MRLTARILHGLAADVKFVFMPFAVVWDMLHTVRTVLYVVRYPLVMVAGNRLGSKLEEAHKDLEAEESQAVVEA